MYKCDNMPFFLLSFFQKIFHKFKSPDSVTKKYVSEAFFVWGFAVFLTGSCMLLNHMEERLLEQDMENLYSYHLEWDNGGAEVIDVTADIATPGKLNARYALLMDASNRRVLYEKAGYEKVPMASTTKIMTLLVTLENANLDDLVTVSKYAASMPDVQLNIKADEQYRLRDLLYSLMLESHNDTAVAIAEHVGGSVEGFAAMMNEKAKELGAYDTNFVTPNGLDAENHYTTAYDLALISSYAIENEQFLNIIQTPSYTFHEQTKGRGFTVNNKDRFLTSYAGAIGIKTGFTAKAGYCFVGAVDRDGKRFVSVVLACGWPPHKTYKWKDTMNLMNYGVQQFNMKEVLAVDTAFQKIPVLDSIEDEPITPYTKDSVALLLRDDEKVSFDIELPQVLTAPVKQEQTIGKITILVNDEVYQVIPLYSKEERTKITYEYILKRILSRYFLIDSTEI